MVEAVGHAYGDLDPVVERLQARVGVAESDGSEDVVPAPADLPAWFDDLGDARVAGPVDPSFEFPPSRLGRRAGAGACAGVP